MAKKITRRNFLKNAVVGGVALGTGLGGYRVTYGQAKKAAGPIKIGGQGATSGAHADYGWQMMAGGTLAIEEINTKGGILGRKLELKFMDEELKPVTTDLDVEGCPSRVDIGIIRRVIDRIIENALEVSSPGKAIHVHSARKSDCCELRITDEGLGIKPEHLPQIFKPFFTTKEKGDGLTLSSSQKLMRDMGGEIQVSSEYGKGATFTVIVPREYSGSSLAAGPIATMSRETR